MLAWLHTSQSNFQAAVAAGIDVGISGWELDAVVAAAREQERPARVHLKVDTGLGRNGCTIADWDQLVGQAMEYQDQGLLRVVGIFSHLAVADEPHRPETDEQLAVFREAIAMAEDAGWTPKSGTLPTRPPRCPARMPTSTWSALASGSTGFRLSRAQPRRNSACTPP